MMKLFLILQDVNERHDTYDSAVVAAPDEATAQKMNPQDGQIFPATKWRGEVWGEGVWCKSPEQVKVRYIGEAAPNVG